MWKRREAKHNKTINKCIKLLPKPPDLKATSAARGPAPAYLVTNGFGMWYYQSGPGDSEGRRWVPNVAFVSILDNLILFLHNI